MLLVVSDERSKIPAGFLDLDSHAEAHVIGQTQDIITVLRTNHHGADKPQVGCRWFSPILGQLRLAPLAKLVLLDGLQTQETADDGHADGRIHQAIALEAVIV